MNENDLSTMRKEYVHSSLKKREVATSPFTQFERWFSQVKSGRTLEPNAMALATVNEHGSPSVRMVLLKEWSESGFTFFTHYHSRKGRDIEHNSNVALLFYWGELERQIRIEGTAQKISADLSDRYFRDRPRGSQLSASVSRQSTVVTSRDELELLRGELDRKTENSEIPRPADWGGYQVTPLSFEFWQGREDRLHDRILYSKGAHGWSMSRLAP